MLYTVVSMQYRGSKTSEHQNYLEGLLKPAWLGLGLRISEFLGLRCDSRICIPNKFPGKFNVDAVG